MKTSLSSKLFLCAAAVVVGILSDFQVYAQPDGTPLWTNRYDGPGNTYDVATIVAVDGSGNAIVTGSLYEGAGSYDYETIKYSGAGTSLWTNRYSGPGNTYDFARAIALEGNGNLIVTGDSWSGISYDYATIKYSEAGVPLWTNRYNGPASSTDVPHAVAVDSGGNVIVTGESYANGGYPDYATIKYSGAGAALWTNRYNGSGNFGDIATAVAVDAERNVIVTGQSFGFNTGYDYTTIKYSSGGVPLWTNRYNLPGHDYVRALAVDGRSNVIVSGTSTLNNTSNYVTIKYSGAGVALWTNRYKGPGDGDYVNATAVDGAGNVFVTGSSWSGSSYDYATIKYSSVGVALWTNRYNGPGNSDDVAYALAVDGNGNLIVTGHSQGSDSGYDYATIKYSSAGVPLWTNRYNGSGNGDDITHAVAVDGSGNVFVIGASWNGASYDFVTIKYSSVGLPSLTIARTATNTVAVSWPSPAADFTLQENTNVASTNWMPVRLTPPDDGTNKTVIVDPPEGNRFYRLFHP